MYFLNINKSKGISSFDCIKILRRKLKIKSIGHSGTLDPLASGVLQIAVGSATKLLDYLESDKTYIADIKFGYNSTTMDDEGEKIFISKPNFTKEMLVDTLQTFIGKTMQIPPKFSAIKQNGQKLCDIARKNPDKLIVLPKREIEIYYIKLLDFAPDRASIEVKCKKGTYIRSLVQDIGDKLNCGAYITDLKRIRAGNFDIKNSQDVNSDTFKQINPLDVLQIEKYALNDIEYKRVMNGLFISVSGNFSNKDLILTKDNKLVSIAYVSDNGINGCIIKPRKNFKEA